MIVIERRYFFCVHWTHLGLNLGIFLENYESEMRDVQVDGSLRFGTILFFCNRTLWKIWPLRRLTSLMQSSLFIMMLTQK